MTNSDAVLPGKPQLGALNPPPAFRPGPGETPRAFSAFLAWFTLGHTRSLRAVADQLGENLSTVKKWSVRHRWSERVSAFNAGLLQQQVDARIALHREHAADWARRTRECREQEWETAQKLRAAAQCFLETVGDREVGKMTLAQASRALQVAARLARQALSDAPLPETTLHAPIQLEIEAALKKAFGQPSPEAGTLPQTAAPAHPLLTAEKLIADH